MSVENENRIHAALGLSFLPQQMIVRVCRGVLLSSIEQIAPGFIECELAEGLAIGEALVATSVGLPPPTFQIAQVMRTRISVTRWRFATFFAGSRRGAEFGPADFDAIWFRPFSGGAPVATIQIP